MNIKVLARKSAPTPETMRARLKDILRANENLASTSPLHNPVLEAALHVSDRLHDGSLTLGDLSDLVQSLSTEAFTRRADRLRAYVSLKSRADCLESLRSAIRSLAHDETGNRLPFETFRKSVEREATGIVLTAHPTFGLSRQLCTVLAELASGQTADGKPLDEPARRQRLALVSQSPHIPDNPVDLPSEQSFAEQALENLRLAIQSVHEVVIETAKELYPKDWTTLSPRLATVATWVGFDIDGRKDIGWADMIAFRLRLAQRRIETLIDRLRAVTSKAGGMSEVAACSPELASLVSMVEGRLILTLGALRGEEDEFPVDPAERAAYAKKILRRLDKDRGDLCRSPEELASLLDKAVPLCPDTSLKTGLAAVRADLRTFGLASGHVHFRLNASHLHNAIRRHVGMEGAPDDPANRRRYLTALSGLMESITPTAVSVAALETEPTTAKRVFMVMAQVLQHLDGDTPLRLLIAEADTPFTVLSALYLARRFGIAEHVDISPLFETPTALERGATIIDELLENPHYLAYVKARGRLCIQTGFSDAGRYLGQVSASLAIERLKVKLARVMAAKKMTDIEVVIFDTHGESIGRGGHPVSLDDRLDYLSPMHSRAFFKDRGIAVKQEVSFQGGDGFTSFGTPDLALAVVSRILCNLCGRPVKKGDDPFYVDTDYSLDFFLGLKAFHEGLMESPDFGALLHTFGNNLLHKTGSRVTRRQSDGPPRLEAASASQIRAIPQNTLLQQLGFLANSIGGFGTVVNKDPEHFAKIHAGSERVQRFTALVAAAYRYSSPEVLAAYLELFDPTYWLRRARRESSELTRNSMIRLSRLLEQGGWHERLARVQRRLAEDEIKLADNLPHVVPDACPMHAANDADADLMILHAVRIALMQRMFELAGSIPRFSSNPDVDPDQTVLDIVRLNVEPALTVLRTAFPASVAGPHDTDTEAYDNLHRNLFDPIGDIYDLVRRISTAVSLRVGATG